MTVGIEKLVHLLQFNFLMFPNFRVHWVVLFRLRLNLAFISRALYKIFSIIS